MVELNTEEGEITKKKRLLRRRGTVSKKASWKRQFQTMTWSTVYSLQVVEPLVSRRWQIKAEKLVALRRWRLDYPSDTLIVVTPRR